MASTLSDTARVGGNVADDVLQAIKYLSWILTVGAAFAGSWFFEFTNTDKETGKRSLTKWGKRGIVVASLALVLAFTSTVWGDYDSVRKRALAEQEAEKEKQTAETEKKKAAAAIERVEKSQSDARQLLQIIAANINNIPSAERASVTQRIAGLHDAEDYQRLYPDLYNRIMSAGSYEEFTAPIKEALARHIESRISHELRCKDIKLKQWADTPVRTGEIPLCQDLTQSIGYLVSSDEVTVRVTDSSSGADLDNGVWLKFDDGAEVKLPCNSSQHKFSCDNTTDYQAFLDIYGDLQTKKIVEVISTNRRYTMCTESADLLRLTFSCIRP